MKGKTLRLSPELEKSLLAGVLYGAVNLESVDDKELTPQGLNIFRAARDLILGGAGLPLSLPEIALLLTDVYGVPREQAKASLEAVRACLPAAGGAGEAVRKLRERHALLTIANAASKQLYSGEYNPDRLFEAVAQAGISAKPVTLAEQIGDRIPDAPMRVPLSALPTFTDRIGGGLVGLTVISGEPAVGKSDLVLQAAVDAQRNLPVIHYDLDNGMPTIVEKLRRMLGSKGDDEADLVALRGATRNIYLRDSIRTLDADLVHVPAPALVIVDIFQALPTPTEYERQGLAHWIHRLGGLRRRGYVVLVVSEVNRFAYGNAGMGAFKGSGEIEYVADLAIQLVPHRDGAMVHVIKNRHGAFKGECVTLTREKGLLWREEGTDW